MSSGMARYPAGATSSDGTEYRTGIWIGNQKARRDKLDTAQLRALAGLGAVGRVAAQNAVLTTVCPAR